MALAIIVGVMSIGVAALSAYLYMTKKSALAVVVFIVAILGVFASIEMASTTAIESMRKAFEVASMAMENK